MLAAELVLAVLNFEFFFKLNRKFQTNPNLLASMGLGMVAGAAGGMLTVNTMFNTSKIFMVFSVFRFFRDLFCMFH